MDWQSIFYSAVALALTVGGWFYRELKFKVDKTHEEFLSYKTHIAEHYVKNSSFEKFSAALFAKLDKIEDKIDLKQDKP